MKFQIIPNKFQRLIHAWWKATLESHITNGDDEKLT
jgi:hypothetical protein